MGRNGRGPHLSVRTAGEGLPAVCTRLVVRVPGRVVASCRGPEDYSVGASRSGSCGLFSSLPVSEDVTAVVSVPSKEPQGKCCWTQFATTSTSWKVTILASSFLTTKRSR